MDSINKQYLNLALVLGLFGLSACQGTTTTQNASSASPTNVQDSLSLLDRLSDEESLLPFSLDTLREQAEIDIVDGESNQCKLDYLITYIYPKGSKKLLYHYHKTILGDKLAKVAPQNMLKVYREHILRDYQGEDAYYGEENPLYHLTVNKLFGTEDILSVVWEESSYTGGVHGYTTQGYASFDIKTGQPITESDLFGSGFEEEVGKSIQSALVKKYKVLKVEDLQEQGFFSPKEIVPNGNFMISKEGLYYSFSPYEIASYANGIIDVMLPWEDISMLIRPHSLVEKYI